MLPVSRCRAHWHCVCSRFLPPDLCPPSTLHTTSILLHKIVPTFLTVVLPLCPHACCLTQRTLCVVGLCRRSADHSINTAARNTTFGWTISLGRHQRKEYQYRVQICKTLALDCWTFTYHNPRIRAACEKRPAAPVSSAPFDVCPQYTTAVSTDALPRRRPEITRAENARSPL